MLIPAMSVLFDATDDHSLTLFLAMIFNLTLQPALLLWMDKVKRKVKETEWIIEEEKEEGNEK